MSDINDDKYIYRRKSAGSEPEPAVMLVDLRSAEGRSRKFLKMTHQDSENVQRIVGVACDENDNIIEKHVTYQWPWDIPRLCDEYDRDGEMSFTWLETERYEKNLTFFGSYHIGTSMAVRMENARTVQPFLVGSTLQAEMEEDIRVDEVDESACVVHDGFSKDQLTSPTVKEIMEEQIQEKVIAYRSESPVVDAEDGLPADKDEDEKDEPVCPSP